MHLYKKYICKILIIILNKIRKKDDGLAYYTIAFLSIYSLLSVILFTFYTNIPIGYVIIKNSRLFFVIGFILLFISYKIWKKMNVIRINKKKD